MLLFSFWFVCVCVYWRSPQHTHTQTHACRLVAWHMRIKFWASTCACVCVCVLLFFFSSLFSMVRAKWRRCSSCCVSYLASVAEIRIADTHTHTHLRMSIFCQKMCSCYSHTHTHTRLARALNANDAIFGWASTFRSLLRLATYLSVSVTLTIYCYCDNVCAVYAILLARLHKRHFNEAPRLLFIFLHIAY